MDRRKSIKDHLGRPRFGMRIDQNMDYGKQEEKMHERIKKVDDNWEKWRAEREKKKKGEV